MEGRTDGRTHGLRQSYIPPTLSEDKKTTELETHGKNCKRVALEKFKSKTFKRVV